jgi:flagellar hook-associated protein 3 FlgL
MPVSPINLIRVTQNLRTELLAGSVRRTGIELFQTQTQLATGQRFVAASEDPVAAAAVLDLTEAHARQNRFAQNVRHADQMLSAADTAITDVSSLITEAHSIASQDVSNLTSAAERAADAELIASIRRQLQAVGNRQFGGKYLFAGRETLDAPFIDVPGGIAYIGDTGDLVTRIETGFSEPINIPGNVLFGALTGRVAASVDLSPSLTDSTRVEDITGAAGRGLRPGVLVFNEVGGAGRFTVDLSAADTIGRIVEEINRAAEQVGAAFRTSIVGSHLEISPGGREITVTDTSGGITAADLGILTTEPTSATIIGQDLHPRVTRLTPVEALAGGAGVDLSGGLILTNGALTATVDLSEAQTVQDIIQAIEKAGMFVRAEVNESGTGIDLFNLVSGTTLTVGENTGTTASALGLRTLDVGTLLSGLNSGRGVHTDATGPDLRVTARNGSSFDVELDGATTVGDVIDRINAAATAAGVSITASLAATGNGIRLVDSTGGAGDLSVASTGASTAADDLGLARPLTRTSSEIVGADTGGVRVESVLGALVELEAALRRDDTVGIARAAERVDLAIQDATRVHGVVGAKSQAMRARLQQSEDAAHAAEVFLSEVRDLDFAEAATRLQALQTQMRASLQTGSSLLSLSLLDFLQ